MRTLYLTIGLVIGSLSVGKAADPSSPTNAVTRDWQININGLSCGIQFANVTMYSYLPGSVKPVAESKPPVCDVYGINTSTNSFPFLKMPPTNIFTIELFDSQGKLVEKTKEGRMYGMALSQKQIADWYHKMSSKYSGGWNSFFATSGPPEGTSGPIGHFSLIPAFKIEQPGEYTLHLRTRLILLDRDASGNFPIVWLPEVTAKVQIRPEDIPKTNSVSGE